MKSILGNCGIRTSNHLMGTYFSVNFRDIAELNFNYHHLSAHLYFLFLLFLFLYCLFGRCRSKGSQSYLDKDLITSHHTLHFTFSPPRVLPTLLQGLCSCSLGCCYLMWRSQIQPHTIFDMKRKEFLPVLKGHILSSCKRRLFRCCCWKKVHMI